MWDDKPPQDHSSREECLMVDIITARQEVGNHVLSLIRYPVQSDLFSLVICRQRILEGHHCHIFAHILRRHGVLISGVGDEAVFLYSAQIDPVNDV